MSEMRICRSILSTALIGVAAVTAVKYHMYVDILILVVVNGDE
jgi:hypothetical protein